MFLDIQIFGDKVVSREIVRTGVRSTQMDPAFRSIFRRLDEINAEQFLTRGERGGTPWQELQEATIAQKMREGSKTPDWPERRTDALFEAMASPSSGDREELYGGTWAAFRVTGDPGDYGSIQHHGAPSINLPARSLFGATELDKVEFVKEMQRWIVRGELTHFL